MVCNLRMVLVSLLRPGFAIDRQPRAAIFSGSSPLLVGSNVLLPAVEPPVEVARGEDESAVGILLVQQGEVPDDGLHVEVGVELLPNVGEQWQPFVAGADDELTGRVVALVQAAEAQDPEGLGD